MSLDESPVLFVACPGLLLISGVSFLFKEDTGGGAGLGKTLQVRIESKLCLG